MNINIVAERVIVVEKTGMRDTQCRDIDVWQTPTKVSYKIIEDDNPLQAYKDWVMSISEDEEENVYAEDDFFNEGPPIDKTIVNVGKIHIEWLEHQIQQFIAIGYEIKVEVI